MRSELAAWAIVVAGCAATAAPEVDARVDLDAGAGTDAGVGLDAAAERDAELDSDGAIERPADAGARVRTRLRLVDGREVRGELVATYDHARWWWGPSDQRTYAIFRPELLAEHPDDRSLAFVSSTQIVERGDEPWPAGVPSYRDALREHGVVLGRVPLDGVAYVIAAHERHHLEENGYGDFAWDLVRTDASGARWSGAGERNEDYLVWGAEVFLPARGYVVEVVRDAPDQPPGLLDLDAVNNLVGVQIFGGYYVYLLHMQQGSIPTDVVPGAVLEAGTYVGRVGNSGVSLEPHLHFTVLALDPESDPVRTWSVPSELASVWVASATDTRARLAEHHDPASGEWISPDAFTP
ncbi:MAG: M23 family metallopeptidase [Myxococcota bacterium]|nr:M23 family metallopeptidase [Myxococcota bacterium]